MRGAFGSIFRKLVCIPDCSNAKTCEVSQTCPYARVFEPQSARGHGPSGLADWPRPFVFRASHLDGKTVLDGECFYFDVHLFDIGEPGLAYFVPAFAQLAREGLGPGRVRADLEAVDELDLQGVPVRRAFDGGRFQVSELGDPCSVELERTDAVARVRVRL